MHFRGGRKSPTPHLGEALQRTQPEALDIGRRRAIKTFGGLAAGLLLAESGAARWNSEVYRSGSTSLRMVGGQNMVSPLLAVSFGGEGSKNDHNGATSLFAASKKRIPSADMIYDQRGLNFHDMEKVLQDARKRRGLRCLLINGDSEGAMISLVVAARAGIPMAGFIANSGIMSIRNAKGAAQLTTEIVTSSTPANPTNKFFGDLVGDLELASKDLGSYFRDSGIAEAITGLPNELATLPDQMAGGGSPVLQESQLEFAKKRRIQQLVPELRKGDIIKKDFTLPVYLRAPQDPIIDPYAAHEDYEGLFARFGIRMPIITMPEGSRHADVFAGAAVLRSYDYFDAVIERANQLTPGGVTML